jgi:hypothetical protein
MERSYRISGKLREGPVIWFVNRSMDPGCYALDEAFSREEAERLQRFLQDRSIEYRIQEIPPESAGGEQSPVWILIGRLVELKRDETDRLSFAVVGCLEL